MSSCIQETINFFKPGSMESSEAVTNAAMGAFGAITAIALMILQAPFALSLSVLTISAIVLTGSLMESRGIVYSTWIALFAFAVAAAMLSPTTLSYHVVWYV